MSGLHLAVDLFTRTTVILQCFLLCTEANQNKTRHSGRRLLNCIDISNITFEISYRKPDHTTVWNAEVVFNTFKKIRLSFEI